MVQAQGAVFFVTRKIIVDRANIGCEPRKIMPHTTHGEESSPVNSAKCRPK
jgi:hypothetical protein